LGIPIHEDSRDLSIFLRLLVEVEGKRERDVEESELIIFFFEGVLANAGKWTTPSILLKPQQSLLMSLLFKLQSKNWVILALQFE
jgi:hypothetical protein